MKTKHTFSFATYYDPARTHFGKLRVLNDDIVAPGRGFGTHSHEDMEIVSIPLSGSLAHKDSAGHEEVIRPNDIQVMSAGAGHSTFGIQWLGQRKRQFPADLDFPWRQWTSAPL